LHGAARACGAGVRFRASSLVGGFKFEAQHCLPVGETT
jgi:hypothetical protein